MPLSKGESSVLHDAQEDMEYVSSGNDNAQSGHAGQSKTLRSKATRAVEEPSTPRNTHHKGLPLRSPYLKTNSRTSAYNSSRVIFTPVGGRKYTRGTVDVAATPKRTTMDPMRIAVSKTPFTTKRGIADYEAEKDPIKTYLRLKPADKDMFVNGNPTSLLQLVSDKEVEMQRDENDNEMRERYLFAGVMHSMSKQPRVFDLCVVPVVKDLFAGYNTLLFTYGITNSGKTYTVQGNSENPGMLPRSIQAILGVLDANNAQGNFPIKPKYATQVEYCTDPRIVNPTFRIAPGEDAWVNGLSLENPMYDPEVADIAHDLQQQCADGEWAYQLYVSYFEVYNEMIYDLLDLTTLTTVHVKPADGEHTAASSARRGRGKRAVAAANTRGKRKQAQAAVDDSADPLHMSASQISGLARTPLLLRSEGGRGNEAFVEGATEVRVCSARDLIRVLIHGQMRRSVHATGMNTGSSRSHALMQARLIKIRRNAVIDPLEPIPSEAQASVRTMTIVDLAGSERAKRTNNQGDRLAEAGKINVSLMTLKKCLDVKRYNATLAPGDPNLQLVPYNESKVTRLFQPALEGGARTIMVVCVDSYDHGGDFGTTCAEIKGVLDFARVASELVTRVRRVEDPQAHQVLDEGTPTRAGGRRSLGMRGSADWMLSDDDGDNGNGGEDEDEVFFDTNTQRPASRLARKRKSTDMEPGSSDLSEHGTRSQSSAQQKRQRNGLAGGWQHPATRAVAEPKKTNKTLGKPPVAAAAASSSSKQVSKAAITLVADSFASSVWESITRNSPFSFELPPDRVLRDAPLLLSQTFAMNNEHKREIVHLREALASAHEQLRANQNQKEIDELVSYADALEAAMKELREKYISAQERVLRIEEETRAEVSAFFMQKIADLKSSASERLQDELTRSEIKAAHKIDILSRLRTVRSSFSDSEEEDNVHMDAAQVPTVSPRTAVRRAVSRAASKKANKMGSVSAGENREIRHLNTLVESSKSQISSLNTQLELVNQTRNADRATREALEAAVVEANSRAAGLEARLMRISSAHSAETELAMTKVHERERAEFLAQITMLKTQLREAETQALSARREWETREMLPVQERLRALVSVQTRTQVADTDSAEALERAERERDEAWTWWTREQQLNTRLCAQNDLLMREIRLVRAHLGQGTAGDNVEAEPTVEMESEDAMDSDDSSLCIVTLKSSENIPAINSGNPIAANPSQSSFAMNSTQALSQVLSKGRVLQRNPTRALSQQQLPRDSSDSFAPSVSNLSPPQLVQQHSRQHAKLEGAKRVVSRMFKNLNSDSKKRDPSRPYMAGRFANTDTAVGSYSAEVFSLEAGEQAGLRARGNTMESVDSVGDARQAKMRSIVYSGPIVAHATGGVSVTFTSEEVHDMPLVADAIPEQTEEEDEDNVEIMDITSATDANFSLSPIAEDDSSSAQGTKRTRSVMRRPGVPDHRRQQQQQSRHKGQISDVSGMADVEDENDDDDGIKDEDMGEDENEDEDEDASGKPKPVDIQNQRNRIASTSVSLDKQLSDYSPPHSNKLLSASVADLTSTVKKKKRRLHAGRTVLNVGTPDSDYEADRAGASSGPLSASISLLTPSKIAGSWPPASPANIPRESGASNNAKMSKPSVPQTNKQPVLFTPVRTRSKTQVSADFSPPTMSLNDGNGMRGEDKTDNIFLTPIKMLSRLRNRKK
ncbi:hypothetical protein FB645_000927 [Coemansia sp. IMI 203386]|nr:hypothetical protein FB645_000927 [Coemansia sp. IMI 203386]